MANKNMNKKQNNNQYLTYLIVAIAVIAFALSNKNAIGNLFHGSDTSTVSQTAQVTSDKDASSSAEYFFRNSELLNEHFQKHGGDFDYASPEEYEAGASAVVTSGEAMHKTEAEDGDDAYYIESTNEFVIVSKDGYIRTYFKPDDGIDYFNRQ